VNLTGVLADRYEIEREIGRGGMATVYLAHDLRHDSTVAIKVLHPELAAFLGHARFDREIQITARLQHPNILPIFDSGRAADLPYYVTPYIEGESLADRLQREHQLPLNDALAMTCEIADALAYAHERGIVHRDIKPANILLTHGHAVVADFGIAHIAEVSRDAKLTDSGMAIGTVAYMSPEQASGGNVDGRSDIYGLGCVLYEMLAGQPPFSGASPQAVIARHMVDPPPPLRGVRPSVSRKLEAVVRKAIAKSPADRFANATAFRDAIRRVSSAGADYAVTNHDASWWRRRPMLLGSIGVIAAMLIATLLLPRYLHLRRTGADSSSTANLANIAVLYFDDNSPKHDMGYLASGLTDELIHELSVVPALHVISRDGVLPFRDHPVGLDSIASVLHVGTVLTGSVQKSGDNVRVDAELIDARTGDHLDSRTIEHPMADLFALEDDVSQQVATLLRTRLGQQLRVQQIEQGTSSVQARELLLRGADARDAAAKIATDNQAGNTQDAIGFLQRADSLLAQAETADPQWVQPVIARGWLMWSIVRLLPEKAGSRQLELARVYADAAVRRSPNSAEALELQGTVFWELAKTAMSSTDARYVLAAERDLRSAVAIEPTLARAWGTLSAVLRFKGDVAEANVAARRALTEDAFLQDAPSILEALYTSEQLLGDYASARESCDNGRRRYPADWRFVECRLTLMSVDTATANPKEAWALVAKLDAMDPPVQAAATRDRYNPIFWRMVAALISARAGQRDSARAVIAWATREVGNDPDRRLDLDYDEAYVRLALGQPDVALRLLTEYATARPTLKSYIARDPHFAALRNNPQFATQFTAMLQTPAK
jgi:serine/threonine protein kinase/tetratricopeptide (TPR) repeat protein